MIRAFLFVALLFLSFNSLAEALKLEPPLEAMKEVFEKIDNITSVEVQLATPTYSFYIGAPDINGVAYVPNFNPQLRLGLGWKDLRFAANVYSIPLPPEENERRGLSDQLNFILGKYWRESAVDIYYQYYRGFYLANPITEFDLHKPTRYPQLPDAEIVNYGINYYRVMDPSKYSLAAGFKQTEIQRLSGGSFVGQIFFNHVKMNRGSKLTPGSDTGAVTVLPEIKNSKLNTLGVSFGYGYTFVSDYFFFSNQALAGAGAQHQTILSDGAKDTSRYNLALKLNLNSALGRNFAGSSYGLRFLLDSLLSNVDDVQLYSTLASFQFFYIHRF